MIGSLVEISGYLLSHVLCVSVCGPDEVLEVSEYIRNPHFNDAFILIAD